MARIGPSKRLRRRDRPQAHKEYTTCAQRKQAGGFTGDITGLERAWLLYGDFVKRHYDADIEYPLWFDLKFEIPPAHKYNNWELSILKGEKFLITQARFELHCTNVEDKRGPPFVEIEKEAFLTASKFIADYCKLQLLREGGELSQEESEVEEELEGEDESEQESEKSGTPKRQRGEDECN